MKARNRPPRLETRAACPQPERAAPPRAAPTAELLVRAQGRGQTASPRAPSEVAGTRVDRLDDRRRVETWAAVGSIFGATPDGPAHRSGLTVGAAPGAAARDRARSRAAAPASRSRPRFRRRCSPSTSRSLVSPGSRGGRSPTPTTPARCGSTAAPTGTCAGSTASRSSPTASSLLGDGGAEAAEEWLFMPAARAGGRRRPLRGRRGRRRDRGDRVRRARPLSLAVAAAVPGPGTAVWSCRWTDRAARRLRRAARRCSNARTRTAPAPADRSLTSHTPREDPRQLRSATTYSRSGAGGVGSPRGQGLSKARFLTVQEVADLMRVSSMTVYRLIKAGELPAVRVGRSFRVAEADVDAYLASVHAGRLVEQIPTAGPPAGSVVAWWRTRFVRLVPLRLRARRRVRRRVPRRDARTSRRSCGSSTSPTTSRRSTSAPARSRSRAPCSTCPRASCSRSSIPASAPTGAASRSRSRNGVLVGPDNGLLAPAVALLGGPNASSCSRTRTTSSRRPARRSPAAT